MTNNMEITKEVQEGISKCPDYLDFPTAWAIQNTMNEHVKHKPRCSSVEGWCALSGPAFLCDCGGVDKLWNEII